MESELWGEFPFWYALLYFAGVALGSFATLVLLRSWWCFGC